MRVDLSVLSDPVNFTLEGTKELNKNRIGIPYAKYPRGVLVIKINGLLIYKANTFKFYHDSWVEQKNILGL